MGIGLGVFLIIAGAVLAFGVKADVQGLDLATIGYVLMGGGVLVILLSLLIFMPRTRRAVAPRSAPIPSAGRPSNAMTASPVSDQPLAHAPSHPGWCVPTAQQALRPDWAGPEQEIPSQCLSRTRPARGEPGDGASRA